MNNGQVRSMLFSFWDGRLQAHERLKIRHAIEAVEARMPDAHRALISAHVDGRRDVNWNDEAQAVEAIRSLLSASRKHSSRA